MLVQSQNEHYEEGDIILGGIFPIYEKKEVAYKNCSGKFNVSLFSRPDICVFEWMIVSHTVRRRNWSSRSF